MQVHPLPVVLLLAANRELRILDAHFEILGPEAGDRQRDAQVVLGDLLDIVGRITVARGLRHPVERSLEMLEAEQQWAIQSGQSRHVSAASS